MTTHCPCQMKTGPLSSVQTHISIVYTPLFASSLIVVPSQMFRMRGFFSSSTTMFPARTTFCFEMRGLTTLALLKRYAPLNSFFCFERNFLFKQVSDLFSIRCYKFLWRCFVFKLDTREHCFRHYMACGAAPESMVALFFHPSVLHFNDLFCPQVVTAFHAQ